MNPRARAELVGIGALVVGLFLGLTLAPWHVTGNIGAAVGGGLMKAFGVGSIVIPVLGIGWALAAFGRLGSVSSPRAAILGAGLIVLLPYAVAVVSGVAVTYLPDYALWSSSQRLVGLVPAFFVEVVERTTGPAGATLIGLFALSALGVFTVGWHPLAVLRASGDAAQTKKQGKGKRDEGRGKREAEEAAALVVDESEAAMPPPSRPPKDRKLKPAPKPKPVAPPPPPEGLIPPIELLNEPSAEAADVGIVEIDQMGQRLIQTLETFKVGGRIADRTIGPVVTRFEIEPGPGVKVGRISGLADDLALSMKAQSLRILAPIPGKAAVGIEVPNPHPRMVVLRELLSGDFRSERILPVALGRNIEGEEVVADLAKMPHLLIAGQTGSGKSVCINTIITSLIYAYPPERLKLLMIDPKMVELSMYGSLPHLGMQVVTNHRKAAHVFKWAVQEMEYRYKLLHANHARNVIDFNKKVTDQKPLKGPRETLASQEGIQKELQFDGEYKDGILPYVVLVVDELADLMLTVQGEIETPLAQLAQKARAIGIHLLLATQRPSVNVITGIIKANFPSRIAFRVASKVDSRTILDGNGAESLLGNGDMLFLPPGKSEPVRVQGAFIGTDETEKLMEWYKGRGAERPEHSPIEAQIEAIEAQESAQAAAEGSGDPGERDPLFRQAAEVCIQNQLGSTSLLQRRMSIGYGRAARIIDQLEMAGVLGPANGSKPRDVLVGIEDLDEL
ncbi:MAG TPA: DNA translocase FtsK [Gemmatimonadales bacterium]|nr:DNA translocase FtsK [Gemmatimonadales bacterium]